MGQYYHGAVVREDKIIPFHFDSAKLMEFSWLGNLSVNGLMAELEKAPARVATVGDYAENVGNEEDDSDRTDWPMIKELYSLLWEWGISLTDMAATVGKRGSAQKKYIINHTKREFIDLAAYAKRASALAKDINAWGAGEWVPHPLTLLTAAGNGRGGGDYRGPNLNMIGTWYMDMISVSETRPDTSEFCEWTGAFADE